MLTSRVDRSFSRCIFRGCGVSALGGLLFVTPCRVLAQGLGGMAVPDEPVVSAHSDLLRAPAADETPMEPPISAEASVPQLATMIRGGELPVPAPKGYSRSAAPSLLLPAASTHPVPQTVNPRDCPYDQTHAKGCGVNWGHLAIESSLYLTFQNAGNVYTGYWYRWETTHGKWWDRYIDSAAGWRWNRWSDDNPLLDDYVGHPIMGSITNWIWIQNDSKGKTLEQGNNWPYYRSRLRAMAFSTAYSFQWKLGPIGEASIGHNGDHYYYDKGKLTNETGWVELVTTPVGGTLWTMAEDALDKHVIMGLERRSHNPFLLTTYQILNPSRATANFLRLRAPWYRDTRTVRASGFWSDPGDQPELGNPPVAAWAFATRGVSQNSDLPYPQWGGKYELGTWWGVSWSSGGLFGNETDTKYMPIDIRYSQRLSQSQSWSLRYSPELTALAMVDVPVPGTTDPLSQRKRTYGSGLSPEGFQLDFLPQRRVQPFLSQNAGFIYFMSPALSPEGSHLVYTVDFGGGVNIFHLQRQAVTLGYRYQHLHDANFGAQVTGTDANTFYLGISRFRGR
jgi:hypothetical protein